MAADVPRRWVRNTWEDKARENPFFAVQTTDEMLDAPAEDFSEHHIEQLFERGRRLYREQISTFLAARPEPREETFIVEYGCGVGRILRAIVDAGYRCAGIDISPTMVRHCLQLVPEVDGAYVIDEAGRSALADGVASLVFSFAVVQHISKLSNYERAVVEMCRVLRPGGTLAVHLNCEDFTETPPTRTENFEDYSLHFRDGESEPYQRHDQQQWSGVYIGYARLVELLAGHGVTVERWYYHNPNKLRALWVVARKAA